MPNTQRQVFYPKLLKRFPFTKVYGFVNFEKRLLGKALHSEKRNDFDVKETSRNIVDRFSSDSSIQSERVVSFENVMENRDKADTARYFFSMLQMVSVNKKKILKKTKTRSSE